MKKLFLFTAVCLYSIILNAQQYTTDSLIKKIEHAIHHNPAQFVSDIKKEFATIDSTVQLETLEYLSQYSTVPLFYLNMNKYRSALTVYYYSPYTSIRQKATNLLLETYRLAQGDVGWGWIWYDNSKLSDFNEEAKGKIMDIITCKPFSDIELDLLYKYELHIQTKSNKNDTVFIRPYMIKSLLTIEELRDSLATDIAKRFIEELTPKKFVDDFSIFYLSSWLRMYESIPYIEKFMNNATSSIEKQHCKLLLARMGNTMYEKEILDSLRKEKRYDYGIYKFIETPNVIDEIIESLKLNKKQKGTRRIVDSNGKIKDIKMEWYPPNCGYLRDLVWSKMILNLPFTFDAFDIAYCEVPYSEIKKVIQWLDENRNNIIFNPDVK